MNADSSNAAGQPPQPPPPPQGAPAEELERDIERTREDLGRTVDALAAKADVKTRVQQRIAELDRQRPGVLYGGTGAALAVVALVIGLTVRRRRR
ncbi:MAG TPA: DUF3618 domain-containing protein [Nocardioidaceae bacterium]|nr:DUF3618 domain-containing protein [Nocardioidaceae bacterium]